jgi:hypothetical protein
VQPIYTFNVIRTVLCALEDEVASPGVSWEATRARMLTITDVAAQALSSSTATVEPQRMAALARAVTAIQNHEFAEARDLILAAISDPP